MSLITTHVLDSVRGKPAEGVAVTLRDEAGTIIAQALTDGDGRVSSFGPEQLAEGIYQVHFDTGRYFDGTGRAHFYPWVTVAFVVAADPHYHIPLLLGPYGYTTYRGS